MKIILEGYLAEAQTEDSGQARICEFICSKELGTDGEFFVRLQSWKDHDRSAHIGKEWADKHHQTLRNLEGKKIRVTIKTIEE